MVGGGDRDWTAVTAGPSVDQLISSRLGARNLTLGVHVNTNTPSATYKTPDVVSERGTSQSRPT